MHHEPGRADPTHKSMNTIAQAVEQAELDTYTKDAHAFHSGRYSILAVHSALPGDHVRGGKRGLLARIHANSPDTIYDNNIDGSNHGRLCAATIVALLRLGVVETNDFKDIYAPTDSPDVLKTWGEEAHAYVSCILHPRAATSPMPFLHSEVHAKKLFDQHPETHETSMHRLQAATDYQLANPDMANPFLSDTFKTQRTSAK